MQHFGPAVVAVAFPCIPCPPHIPQRTSIRLSAAAPSPVAENDEMQPPLRQCQRDCLAACAQGARVIEMACGTGKTRVIQELVSNVSGRVPWAVDSFQFCEYQCFVIVVLLASISYVLLIWLFFAIPAYVL